MEIKINKSLATTTFGELHNGDVFIDFPTDTPENNTYLVLSVDYGLGTNTGYDGFAVDLSTGELYGFEDSDEVIKVDANLTVNVSIFP